jgi:hypothetical protein
LGGGDVGRIGGLTAACASRAQDNRPKTPNHNQQHNFRKSSINTPGISLTFGASDGFIASRHPSKHTHYNRKRNGTINNAEKDRERFWPLTHMAHIC